MNQDIEQIKKEFDEWCDSIEWQDDDDMMLISKEQCWGAIERAVNRAIESTCKAMLVEERGWGSNNSKYKDENVSEELYHEQLEVLSHNQCCALQREKANKLKEQLNI